MTILMMMTVHLIRGKNGDKIRFFAIRIASRLQGFNAGSVSTVFKFI